MLTVNKPAQYGYRPVHDLPTPPNTSRPSPPLTYPDRGQWTPFSAPGGSSPSDPLMSAPHRGLPPPAGLPPVQPPPVPGHSQPPPPPSLPGGQAAPPAAGLPPVQPPAVPAHSHAPQPPGLPGGQAAPPPPSSQSQGLDQLPPAPPWHDESMRTWLVARAEQDKRRQEEEKTRQEEEKTKQESYRLEQRRTEHEILRTSLQGGIPPPLVPIVFAGMGGAVVSPAALEWAQRFMSWQSGQQQPPALMPPGPVWMEHQRRDSQAQAYLQYPASGGVPSTPGSAQGPPSAYMPGYPGPPTRPRGQSLPGSTGGPALGGGQNLPNLSTGAPGGPGSASAAVQHPGIAQSQQQQQEPQPSPSIYFHHWQPPTTQAGGRSGTDQPAAPSVGESPRKRKAASPQQSVPPPSATQRLRSPPFSHSTGLSNPPPGRRRGHSRQRSDLGSYRPGGEMSPMPGAGSASQEMGEPSSSTQQQHRQQQAHTFAPPPPPPPPPHSPARTGAHSVSSLLSDNKPPAAGHFPSPRPLTESRHHQYHYPHQQQHQQQQFGEGEQRLPEREEKLRSGGVPGSSATRPGDND